MNTGLASFDIFDTLLTRAVGAPTSLFLLLGKVDDVVRLSGCGAEEFARLRIAAERRARIGRREVTLRQIYAEFGAGLGLSPEDQRALADQELALERRLSRLVPGSDRRLKDASGGRRVGLSDMYLPEAFVSELLQQHGLDGLLDRLIVSSEVGVTKSDGGLFRHLLETEGTAARCARHVGDNALADVRVPRLLGLSAEHLGAAKLNRYEEIWERHRWETGGLSSLVAGASRLARLQAGQVSPELLPVIEVAAGVAAPTLSAYILWVLRSAQREGRRRLYFLARDGEVLYLIAQRLVEKLGIDLELRYLYGSRSVYHRAGLATKEIATAAWAWNAMYRLSAFQVLQRLGLGDDPARAALMRLGLDDSAPATEDVIEQLTGDEQIGREIRDSAGQLLERVRGYLRSAGLFDGTPYAVVDTGWAGRIVESLTALFPPGVEPLERCYLFGYMKLKGAYSAPDVIRAYLFNEWAGIGCREGLDQAYGPLESFAAANHGMTVDFLGPERGYEPVLASPTNPVLDGWPWETYRATLMRFVDEWLLDEDIAARDADLRSGVADVLTEFWSRPSVDEAAAWGSFVYEDDILGASRNTLAKAIRPGDFLGKVGRRYEGKRLWLAASVQLSPAPVRPFARAGLWFNECRRSEQGTAAFLPRKWARRADLIRLAATTRSARKAGR